MNSSKASKKDKTEAAPRTAEIVREYGPSPAPPAWPA